MKSSITIISLPILLLASGMTASANMMAPPRPTSVISVPIIGENAKALHRMMGGEKDSSDTLNVECPKVTDAADYSCKIVIPKPDGNKLETLIRGPVARILQNKVETLRATKDKTDFPIEFSGTCTKDMRGESACEIKFSIYQRR